MNTIDKLKTELTRVEDMIRKNERYIQAQLSSGKLSSYPRRIAKRQRLTKLAKFWEYEIAKEDIIYNIEWYNSSDGTSVIYTRGTLITV